MPLKRISLEGLHRRALDCRGGTYVHPCLASEPLVCLSAAPAPQRVRYTPVVPRAAVCFSLPLWRLDLEAAGQGTEQNSHLDEKSVIRSYVSCTALHIKHATL